MSKHRQRASQAVRKYPRLHSENTFCNHPHRICMQDRLDGYEFCLDHILQDKTASFKQCNFVSPKNGKRCSRAAPKADKKDGYCKVHTRKAAMMRYKASLKGKPKDPSQELLDELDCYRQESSKSIPDAPVSTISKIMDYGSASDSDNEPVYIDQSWTGGNESDAESGDSEQEDALRHAGVYSAEEVALITRDKLIRLQSLYINQFKRLQHVMKESRRRYLANLKKERSHYGDNLDKITDPNDQKKLKKLKALHSYRRRKGREALLHRKSRQRRILATQDYNGPVKLINLPNCTYQPDDGQKCDKTCFPLTKFCMDHIIHEPRQFLFRPCRGGGSLCTQPALPQHVEATCLLHLSLPPYKPRVPMAALAPPIEKKSEFSSSCADSEAKLPLSKNNLHDPGVLPRLEMPGRNEPPTAAGQNQPASSNTLSSGIRLATPPTIKSDLAAIGSTTLSKKVSATPSTPQLQLTPPSTKASTSGSGKSVQELVTSSVTPVPKTDSPPRAKLSDAYTDIEMVEATNHNKTTVPSSITGTKEKEDVIDLGMSGDQDNNAQIVHSGVGHTVQSKMSVSDGGAEAFSKCQSEPIISKESKASNTSVMSGSLGEVKLDSTTLESSTKFQVGSKDGEQSAEEKVDTSEYIDVTEISNEPSTSGLVFPKK